MSIETSSKSLDIELPKEVTFYIARLTNLFQVRDYVQAHPFNRYQTLEYPQCVEMVLRGIYGSYRALQDLNYGETADHLLKADRLMHKDKPVIIDL